MCWKLHCKARGVVTLIHLRYKVATTDSYGIELPEADKEVIGFVTFWH